MILFFLFFMLIVSFFVYWCINEKIGLQLGIVVSFSAWIVLLIEHLDIKFPFNIDIRFVVFPLFFFGYLFLRNKIEALLAKGGFRAGIISAAILSFLMILYRPGLEFILPGGVVLGLGTGYCINKRFVCFKSANCLQRKGASKFFTLFARFILGITVLALIVFRVEKIIQHISENQNIFLYTFLCCAVTSLWVSVAAPWVFIKLRLANIDISSEQPHDK